MKLKDSTVQPKIAVVEDDSDLRDTMLDYLRGEGYSVWGVNSAEAFYRRYVIDQVDVVVLDIGLPGEDGLSVLKHLHLLPQLAVIIVSARVTLDDRLAGLRAGADRYLTKPIDLSELNANIEACSKNRVLLAHKAYKKDNVLSPDGLFWLAKSARRLIDPAGKVVELTSREYYFMNCLFEAKGEVVLRQTIIKKTIGPSVVNGSERLDVMLARLRKKGHRAFDKPLPIMTVHQIGYAFTAPLMSE